MQPNLKKTYKPKVLFFVLFMFFNLSLTTKPAYCQVLSQSIRGHVTEANTREPLVGASVIVVGTDPIKGSVTGIDGDFIIENVPIGRYDIQISSMGYETTTLRQVLVSSAKELVLEASLEESTMVMNEIVVKDKFSKDKPLNEMATVSARSFSVEETRRYAGGLDDPARMVSAFAGVASGPATQDNALIIRGNSPKGVHWRLEGVEIPNPSHFGGVNVIGGGLVTIFSSNLLANSDFFTGAFPAEYGNAMAGVFDMKFRNGNNQNREHMVQLGVQGIEVGSEGPFVKGKGSSYLANYRYSTIGLISEILDRDQIATYQDFSFKVNLPTEKMGVFSLYGIGGKSFNKDEGESDSSLWETNYDREQFEIDMSVGATGLVHKYNINSKTYIQSTLAASGTGFTMDQGLFEEKAVRPDQYIVDNTYRFTLASFLENYFGSRHTNKTGFYLHRMGYNLNLKSYEKEQNDLVQYVDDDGQANMFQAYTQSSLQLTPRTVANIGVHLLHFSVNNDLSVEPRVGLKYTVNPSNTISFGYGLHSNTEPLNIYFAKIPDAQGDLGTPNKSLEFTRAHHIVIAYDHLFNDHLRLKVEPYFQYLFNVPVEKGTYYSLLNFTREPFFDKVLVNEGTGRNVGIDLTFERFFKKGFYYMLSSSVFSSTYEGGDGKRYNTRFNSNYLLNILGGKEILVGRSKNNVLGINGRLTFSGGLRQALIDKQQSVNDKEVVFDYSHAYEERDPGFYNIDLTVTYRMNRAKYAGIIAVQLKNAFNIQQFTEYVYNFRSQQIEKDYGLGILPFISYKIEF
ncbi:TonB-dependent receptor [Fulvivirga sediminis]|uniref:TonB-dependent receptor n=1 Tax=Fulvivirga sediminis TaxID=2803949 RepID=A0A937K1N5_9BACT|nr:TonB-dependent receptor [Fulvivirga sediminis]MBL3657520.1 TonB-dependent receptor [Fulvivirga sediminis]